MDNNDLFELMRENGFKDRELRKVELLFKAYIYVIKIFYKGMIVK